MFEYLKGTVHSVIKEKLVLDVQGVGYALTIPLPLAASLQEGDTVTIYTSIVYREDSQRIFGFATKEDKDAFELLGSVSGVGAKTALTFLNSFSAFKLFEAIYNEEVKKLHAVPGIGKKTAERMVIELKDKCKERMQHTLLATPSLKSDGTLALMQLGYKEQQALQAIEAVLKKHPEMKRVEDLLKLALQHI